MPPKKKATPKKKTKKQLAEEAKAAKAAAAAAAEVVEVEEAAAVAPAAEGTSGAGDAGAVAAAAGTASTGGEQGAAAAVPTGVVVIGQLDTPATTLSALEKIRAREARFGKVTAEDVAAASPGKGGRGVKAGKAASGPGAKNNGAAAPPAAALGLDASVLAKRAERFGVLSAPTMEEKLRERAQRFGTAPGNSRGATAAAPMSVAETEEERARRLARAERFGVVDEETRAMASPPGKAGRGGKRAGPGGRRGGKRGGRFKPF